MPFVAVYNFLTNNNLLNSSFLVALVTLVVGFIALYIYRKQHLDDRTNGARVVYSEIVSAENKLRNVRQQFFATDQPVLKNIVLMPYESWSKYKNLLRKDLKDPEWELVENFYNNCLAYDAAVKLDDSYFHQNTLPRFEIFGQYYLKVVKDFIKDHPQDLSFSQNLTDEVAHFRDVFLGNGAAIWYQTMKPVNDARAALVALESTVSLSTAGQKLKKISKLKD